MNEDRQQNQITADHDLLIKLDTKFDILSAKFDALTDSIVDRVETLEKADVQQENRLKELGQSSRANTDDISFLKKWFWIATGALGTLELVIAIWCIKHFGASPF